MPGKAMSAARPARTPADTTNVAAEVVVYFAAQASARHRPILRRRPDRSAAPPVIAYATDETDGYPRALSRSRDVVPRGLRQRGRGQPADDRADRSQVPRGLHGDLRGAKDRANPSRQLRQELRFLRLRVEQQPLADDSGDPAPVAGCRTGTRTRSRAVSRP